MYKNHGANKNENNPIFLKIPFNGKMSIIRYDKCTMYIIYKLTTIFGFFIFKLRRFTKYEPFCTLSFLKCQPSTFKNCRYDIPIMSVVFGGF